MKAGLMVSIIKSIFITQIDKIDLVEFLNRSSEAIRSMNLHNLYMSLMLVKIKDNILTATSAGMPPIYIYRKSTKEVEELIFKAMPLGAVEKFSYKTIETNLEKGDTVLLMSDGLIELFNDKKEIFDDFRVKEIVRESARLSSNQIVSNLFRAGDSWREKNLQNDDMSFVVIKSI